MLRRGPGGAAAGRQGAAQTEVSKTRGRERGKEIKGERKEMEGASGLVAGSEVLRRGGMEARGKTGELLDASDTKRPPRWAPWRRRCSWAGEPMERGGE